MLVELSVVEQRYHAVMEVLAAGASKTDVAARYGVSRQSVHEWVCGSPENVEGFSMPLLG